MKPITKNLISYLFIPALFVVIVLHYLGGFDISFENNLLYDMSNSRVYEITSGKEIRQSFTCKTDNITAVELMIMRPRRMDRSGAWTIEIVDEQSKQKLASKTVLLMDLKNNALNKITLPKMTGVKGRSLALVIRSNTAGSSVPSIVVPTKKKEDTQDIKVGRLTINFQEITGTLRFNLWHESGDMPSQLFNRVTHFKPAFLKGNMIYLVALYIYGLSMVIVYLFTVLYVNLVPYKNDEKESIK